MVTEFDEKGKFFTKVVTKQPIAVVIQLVDYRVKGNIHVRPEQRVKNALDEDETFLAVTEATIFDGKREELFSTSFMAVNRDHILWIIPQECMHA